MAKKKKVIIAKPCKEEVEKYIAMWEEKYKEQEKALDKLINQYPKNNVLTDVLLKAACINSFYHTNILDIYTVAKHICNLNIDCRLEQGDWTLIEDIANVTMETGDEKRFYSFATKYCSHHFKDRFVIYDSYVEKMLVGLKEDFPFSDFVKEDLRFYDNLTQVLRDFISYFKLEKYSIKEIDMYLWRAGKDYFPKPEKKDKKETKKNKKEG